MNGEHEVRELGELGSGHGGARLEPASLSAADTERDGGSPMSLVDSEIARGHQAPTSLVARSLRSTPDRDPRVVYLGSLQLGSRRTMSGALDTIAGLLSSSKMDAAALPWESLRYPHTQLVRTLIAERYAPRTGNKMLSALRGVLREAWRLGYLDAESFQRAIDLKPIRGTPPPTGRSLSMGEAKAIFDACTLRGEAAGARDAAAFALLYGLGLRRSEAVALEISDIDFQDGRVIVLGKGNKHRTVYMDDGTQAAILAWTAIRGHNDGPLLCPVIKSGQIDYRPMSDQALYLAIDRARTAAGVQPFTPHDLRRTYGGDLLDAGADLVTVKNLMGHSSPATTANYDRRGERAKKSASTLRRTPYSGVTAF